MNLRSSFLIALFLLLIVYPTIDTTFHITVNRNTEKSKRKKKTSFDIYHLDEWIDNYDNYFSTNHGGRSFFFRSISEFKLSITKSSVLPSKVIVGKNDFLFLGNNSGQIIDETLGIELFSAQELNKIKKNITDWEIWMKKKGIAFYLAVAPNKHSIYPEHLPFKTDSTRLTKIKQLKLEIPQVIDLSRNLKKNKQGNKLYYHYNTHWTPRGAYFAYEYLMDFVRKDFPDLSPVLYDNFVIDSTENCANDLVRLLDVNKCEYQYILRSEIKVEKLKIKHSKNRRPNYKLKYLFKESNNNLKVLVIRDSFSSELVRYFNRTFENTVFIWEDKLDKDIILKEKPDIVIYEVIERNIDKLKKR